MKACKINLRAITAHSALFSALLGSLGAFAAGTPANTLKTNAIPATTTADQAVYKPIDCVVEFGKFTSVAVASFGGVMVDSTAYGTYGTFNSGASLDTTVALVNGKVAGSIGVALPGHEPNKPDSSQPLKMVGIEISKSPAQLLTFKWTIDGVTYHGPVLSCTGHLWTASSGKSAIMLRAGN